jgi:hypothetical protein
MNDLRIEKTHNSPFVELNRNGQMTIKGRSIPENGLIFYEPIFKWIEEYGHRPSPKTTLDIDLEYINTISSKCILDIFKGFEMVQKKGFEVKINWYYKEDDPDMLESGQEFGSFINVNFDYIAEH